MKAEVFTWLSEAKNFISRKDIKVKYITSIHDSDGTRHYVFYKEKLLPKIIKTILHKK